MVDTNQVIEQTPQADQTPVPDQAQADQTPVPAQAQAPEGINPQIALLNMNITDQNVALNCLIGYIGLAQKRGVFAIDESAKLYECIKQFHIQ